MTHCFVLLSVKFKLKPTLVEITNYMGQPLNVTGQCKISVLHNEILTFDFFIVRTDLKTRCLLGCSYKYISNKLHVNEVKNTDKRKVLNIFEEYSDVLMVLAQ